MLDLPYVVENSAYISTGSTGALPYLVDDANCVMIGRMHPNLHGETFQNDSNRDEPISSIYGSDIVGYLKELGYDPDKSLSDEQKSDSLAFSALIGNDLQSILSALRFGDDDSFRQGYKNFALRACSGDTKWIQAFRLLSKLQLWSEKQCAISKLRKDQRILCSGRSYLHGRYRVDVPKTISRAIRIYRSLNDRLSSNKFLISSEGVTSVDALFFSHLCDALCNIHLFPLLQNFDHIKRYYCLMYTSFFKDYKLPNDLLHNFVKEADLTNESNSFYQPLVTNLAEIWPNINVAPFIIEATKVGQKSSENLDRFRLGGSFLSENNPIRKRGEKQGSENNSSERNERRRQDDESDSVWWAGVVVVSGLFFVAFQGGRQG